jgi:hypothetical protein
MRRKYVRDLQQHQLLRCESQWGGLFVALAPPELLQDCCAHVVRQIASKLKRHGTNRQVREHGGQSSSSNSKTLCCA